MTLLADIHSAQLSEAAQNISRGLRRAALADIWITIVMILIDLPVFAVVLWFAQYAATPTAAFQAVATTGWAILGAVAAVALLIASHGYALERLQHRPSSIARGMLALIAPVLAGTALLATTAPVELISAAALATLLVIPPLRMATASVANWIGDTGLNQRRAVVAGGGENAARLIRGLQSRSDNTVQLYGIFDDREEARSPLQVLGVPKIGGYDDLIAFVRKTEIDMIIISLPLEADDRIRWLMDAIRVLPVEVRLSAYSEDFAFPRNGRDPLIHAMSRSFAPERRLTKRVFDIAVASFAILLFSPIMLVAALAIRLESKGPVIFRQRRHGYNDRVFDVYKFRSMYADQSDPTARQVVTKGDPRVTRVGRFLRRSSIDELPQLFNVLRGELSLVGPRPHAVDALSSGQERFTSIVDGYSARHRLPPGITGWAQINGWRGEIDDPTKLKARFEHDLFYIENWSLWLDIKILIRTPSSLLRSDGAY